VVQPAAHMFAFYFAIMSAITPPVALAVYAAAGLAKSDIWASGWSAVKIGAAGFIVPFMFVYEPALLMIGEWPAILSATTTATIGALLLSAGLNGYFWRTTLFWERLCLVGAAFCLIKPGLWTDLGGAVLVGAVLVSQIALRAGEPKTLAAARAPDRPVNEPSA